MPGSPTAIRLIAQEARALLTRLDRVKPYALNMPMVPAANLSPQAQSAIEQHMIRGRRTFGSMVRRFVTQIETPGTDLDPAETQKQFAVLRLRFNAVLTQFEIFGDVMAQRSEHGTGVWVSGLDTVAADALSVVMPYAEVPPVVCFLDRGIGAAIRRARTRLPGGEENPVGIIRIPRERMIGSGIASSLVHEAGHQGAALIDLVTSLRKELIERQNRHPLQPVWRLWDRWISEIVADLWSIGLLGLTATQGLFAVVSLPRAFVFRIAEDDPHPFPWFRVKLGCGIGNALYPDPQWLRLAQVWEELYPRTRLDAQRLAIIRELEATMPDFIETMLQHRPEKLEGKRVVDLFPLNHRNPARLRQHLAVVERDRSFLQKVPPTLAFAIIGQGRAEDVLGPEQESELLAALLTQWAVRSSLDTSMICASSRVPIAQALRLVS
jgi:hypothetical protein